jgi:hypothetical protein
MQDLRNAIIKVRCETGDRIVDEWTWCSRHAQDIIQSRGNSNQIVCIRE